MTQRCPTFPTRFRVRGAKLVDNSLAIAAEPRQTPAAESVDLPPLAMRITHARSLTERNGESSHQTAVHDRRRSITRR
jgi:hypothetical protein